MIWNKKHTSKQILSIAYTLEKRVFAAATLFVFLEVRGLNKFWL